MLGTQNSARPYNGRVLSRILLHNLSSSNRRLLFDGQNVRKAGNFEYFHDHFVYVEKLHFALLIHSLLKREQHAKTCGRQVGQLCHIDNQNLDRIHHIRKLRFHLGSGSGIQSALQRYIQSGIYEILVNYHFKTSPHLFIPQSVHLSVFHQSAKENFIVFIFYLYHISSHISIVP